MQADDILMAVERIKTTRSRYETVSNYRQKILKEIEIKQNDFEKYAIEMIETKKDDKNFQKIHDKFQEISRGLTERTTRYTYSLKVLQDVINHPYHLPLIQKYLAGMPQDEKYSKDIANKLEKIQKIFSIVSTYLNEKLIPNALQQEKFLSDFSTNQYSILCFIEYDSLYKEASEYYQAMRKEINPIFADIIISVKEILTLMQKPLNLTENHKRAFAVFLLSVSVISLLMGFIPGAAVAGGILGLVTRGVEYIEDALDIHTLDGAIVALVTK